MMGICAHLCFECTGVVQVECEVHKKAMELCIGKGGAQSNSPEFEGIRNKAGLDSFVLSEKLRVKESL